nr:putative ribonuclease H-like domain-containing protein [Tanacetum cinerariifolium]
VLVVKPHFKTPYELFKGRSPALSFMIPFGCHVSILNTLDQLGKFDEKLDEGIFVGYTTTSKAFRVYNIRTRKVEENMQITFLENKPMIAGGGPEWLFGIDALSNLMNYAPVSTITNSNDFAGKRASFDADGHNKDKHGHSKASKSDNQERPNAESSTKTVIIVRPVNTTTLPMLIILMILSCLICRMLESLMMLMMIKMRMEPKKVTQDLDDESWVEAINKVRLVAQVHRQEEGIDYDKVFAPVARIEAIKLFLAYASFMDFNVYQMDMESAFLYGTIKEEVYVSQPLGFVDPEFLDKVYMVEKALYGLHQAPRAWYETLSTYLLDNGFRRGASLDRKPTRGGCQFLGSRLISWQCKKQTIVANSTTEAEYIAASNCCRQVLWLQNQLLDYGYNFMQTKIDVDNESTMCVVKNLVYHSKTKHIEIRHHFIRDSYEKRLTEMVKIHTDYNVADLLTKAIDVNRF